MFDEETILKELTFKAIRSSGSGGQHVNKVSSKVELTFNLSDTLLFNYDQKERLFRKLQNRLTKEGLLILQCGESRSQHKNKDIIIKRFFALIKDALKVPKRRRPTKVPKSVIRKRLKSKRKHSEKKANRQKPDFD
ncbi:MAG: alternative ribosome rescue aminoacyl-tRNA hydrolase ArfB [Algibacter sp.]|uniref:alternative ribosome rescue aminoacyl-tRNA hydrolase ArfB n=1 Tax=Algibacter sp. TaxID=1872428 RepID=UPI00261553CC|nr:alternative ribosome rescue aminoacyl-tRNA hydrolase ArfB [Algibacter sp.]MDG1731166.1 alternative ribosome rescue aminoacyl-tRNA hydrolase ArfB [Algibacter sp.]MDG2178051.1 alternative ribosome rescue aminoacyl-tRNA hydrolase ArfB [Algibacter sp.]